MLGPPKVMRKKVTSLKATRDTVSGFAVSFVKFDWFNVIFNPLSYVLATKLLCKLDEYYRHYRIQSLDHNCMVNNVWVNRQFLLTQSQANTRGNAPPITLMRSTQIICTTNISPGEEINLLLAHCMNVVYDSFQIKNGQSLFAGSRFRLSQIKFCVIEVTSRELRSSICVSLLCLGVLDTLKESVDIKSCSWVNCNF